MKGAMVFRRFAARQSKSAGRATDTQTYSMKFTEMDRKKIVMFSNRCFGQQTVFLSRILKKKHFSEK